jgi:environmental stress-induced protein Ves
MPIRHLGPADYRVMAWRNGAGRTTELARSADAEGLDQGAFDWRVSIADVAASGPFSPFPGYDRVLLQLSGEPMLLSHGARGETRLARLAPYAFSGDWETTGTIGATPARDFNVITRRGVVAADVSVVTLAGDGSVGVSWQHGELLVHALAGAMALDSEGGVRFELAPGDTLVARPAIAGGALRDEGALVAKGDAATVVVVTLRPG